MISNVRSVDDIVGSMGPRGVIWSLPVEEAFLLMQSELANKVERTDNSRWHVWLKYEYWKENR